MKKNKPKMLVLAPHPDDSVLGVGGSIARFTKTGGDVTVVTVAAHMPPLYSEAVFRETVEEARQALAKLGVAETVFLNLPALSVTQMPPPELNLLIGDIMSQLCPQVLLIPFYDRNVDHRAVFDSAMVVSRPIATNRQLLAVAAYELVSSTYYNAPHIEPNFTPNWVVDISDFIELKVSAVACCRSQIGPVPHPRSCEAVRALALFRGSQAGMAYGEGLHMIRMTAPPEIMGW